MSQDEEKRRYNDRVTIDQAARLYIREGLTLAEVSARLEIPARTVESWSSKFDWGSRRKRFLSQDQEIGDLLEKMQLKLARLMTSGEPINPQEVYAYARAISVLNPPASIQLHELEKAEAEGQDLSPEEKVDKVQQAMETFFGVSPKNG